VSVNVSAVELRKTDFVAGVAATLKETGLSSRWLELELTESAIMGHAVTPVLRSLKALGVQLVVDDFGTGYSSMSHLRRFPIDALKVDKSFVREITSGGEGAAIVSAVITMGKSLHQRIIAEGVETREQLAFLQAQRCSEGQGYYFSPPLAAATFADLAVRGLSAR
jgi:diguanylate cyclase